MAEYFNLILQNFTILCLVVGLLILMLTNKNLDERTNRSFIIFVVLVFILDISDITDYYLAGLSKTYFLRYITSSIGYTLRPASLVIIINILLRRKKASILLWIPIAIVGLISITSCFTHWMFWFDSSNYFIRGKLGFISHIASGIYMFFLVFLTIKMHRYISSGEVFVVLYIALICVAAILLESLLRGFKFLLTGAMISSCALYYIIIYIETYRRDILTGLMNRRTFYLDSKRFRNKSIAVISLDLNGLKVINDSQGHSAGDKALQCVGDAMLCKSGRRFLAYRTGGDEFMALGKEQTPKAVEAYIGEMRSILQANGLSAAFGAAYYKPSKDNFDDICNMADAEMYSDKNKYKHRENERK